MEQINIGGATYTLQFGFAAAKLLQEVTRAPFMRVGGGLLTGNIEHLDAAFYACTRADHGTVTRDQCTELVEGHSAAIFKAVATVVAQFMDRDSMAPASASPQKKASGPIRKAK